MWGVLGVSRCTQQRGGSSDTPLSPPRPHDGQHKPGLSSLPSPKTPNSQHQMSPGDEQAGSSALGDAGLPPQEPRPPPLSPLLDPSLAFGVQFGGPVVPKCRRTLGLLAVFGVCEQAQERTQSAWESGEE